MVFFILAQTLFIWSTRYNLYIKSLLTSDIAIDCNMLWNTNFTDQILYTDIFYFRYGFKTFLNEHFHLTFLLLVPIYHLFPSPLTLIVIQTLMPGLTSIFIYKFCIRVFNKKENSQPSTVSHPSPNNQYNRNGREGGSLQKGGFLHFFGFAHKQLISLMISVAYLFLYCGWQHWTVYMVFILIA